MKETGRRYKIMFAMFGPADTGPYGAPVPPPAPRLRNARGRLLSAKQVAKMRYAETAAKVSLDRGIGESHCPV